MTAVAQALAQAAMCLVGLAALAAIAFIVYRSDPGDEP